MHSRSTESYVTTFAVQDERIGRTHLAAWVYPPVAPPGRFPALWCLLLPEASYSGIGCYDLQVPGMARTCFSLTRFLAQSGIGVVTIDHIGTGASSCSADGLLLTCSRVARLYQQVVFQIQQRLVQGTLCPHQPTLAPHNIWLLGGGHGLGGFILTELATLSGFDAVAFFGWTQGPWRATVPSLDTAQEYGLASEQQGYLSFSSRSSCYPFLYGPPSQVSPEVITADEEQRVCIPLGLFDQLLAHTGNGDECVRQINQPVYSCFGESDLAHDPRGEAHWYAASHDLTCFILPEAGHRLFVASRRYEFWDHFVRWIYAHAHVRSTVSIDWDPLARGRSV